MSDEERELKRYRGKSASRRCLPVLPHPRLRNVGYLDRSQLIERRALGVQSPARLSKIVEKVYQIDAVMHVAAWVALVGLTLAAFLLRAPHLDAQSLWRDEVDVLRFASQPVLQLVRDMTKVQHNGPLYYLLVRGWLRLVGQSEFGLRYLALSFGVVSVPLAYRVGRRLVGRQAGLLAALLVTASPYLVWYSQDGKMYAMIAALTLLALWCLLEALATRRPGWWAGFVVAASLSLYTHMLSALMLPVYLITFALAWPHSRQQWRRGCVALGLLTLPYVPLAVWQLPLVLSSHDTGHPFYPLHQMLSLLFNLYSRGTAMVGGWPVVAAFLFALLAGVFFPAERTYLGKQDSGEENALAFDQRMGNGESQIREQGAMRPFQGRHLAPALLHGSASTRVRLFLLVWLFLPMALIYLISLRAPVFEPRYLIFAAPAFYLLVASGVVGLSKLSRAATGLSLALILSFSLLGVWVQAETPIKSDFRTAAGYVQAHHQDGTPIMFQMPYVRYTFEYYYGHDYVALEGPWTNDGKAETEVAGGLAGQLQGYSDVWLVASESWLWDSRGLTQAWLDQHAHLIESASFTLVDVYHYDLTDAQPDKQP
jgi:mannosyltransferase